MYLVLKLTPPVCKRNNLFFIVKITLKTGLNYSIYFTKTKKCATDLGNQNKILNYAYIVTAYCVYIQA